MTTRQDKIAPRLRRVRNDSMFINSLSQPRVQGLFDYLLFAGQRGSRQKRVNKITGRGIFCMDGFAPSREYPMPFRLTGPAILPIWRTPSAIACGDGADGLEEEVVALF